MALGSNQPLTEMSTRSISCGGKGGRCVRLTTLPPSCAVVTKSGNLNFLEPCGPVQACNGTDLPLSPASLYDYSTYTGIKEKHLVDRLPPPSPFMLYLYRSSEPPHHLHVPIVLKPENLNLEPSGMARPVEGLIYLYLCNLPPCEPHRCPVIAVMQFW